MHCKLSDTTYYQKATTNSPMSVPKVLKLGMWNVRCCVNDVKLKAIHYRLKERNFRLSVLTETLMRSGVYELERNWTLYNSGHGLDSPPRGGVGFLVDSATFTVAAFRECSNRLTVLRVECDGVPFSVLGCYGPTNRSVNKTEKGRFYCLLDKVYNEENTNCSRLRIWA